MCVLAHWFFIQSRVVIRSAMAYSQHNHLSAHSPLAHRRSPAICDLMPQGTIRQSHPCVDWRGRYFEIHGERFLVSTMKTHLCSLLFCFYFLLILLLFLHNGWFCIRCTLQDVAAQILGNLFIPKKKQYGVPKHRVLNSEAHRRDQAISE